MRFMPVIGRQAVSRCHGMYMLVAPRWPWGAHTGHCGGCSSRPVASTAAAGATTSSVAPRGYTNAPGSADAPDRASSCDALWRPARLVLGFVGPTGLVWNARAAATRSAALRAHYIIVSIFACLRTLARLAALEAGVSLWLGLQGLRTRAISCLLQKAI